MKLATGREEGNAEIAAVDETARSLRPKRKRSALPPFLPSPSLVLFRSFTALRSSSPHHYFTRLENLWAVLCESHTSDCSVMPRFRGGERKKQKHISKHSRPSFIPTHHAAASLFRFFTASLLVLSAAMKSAFLLPPNSCATKRGKLAEMPLSIFPAFL